MADQSREHLGSKESGRLYGMIRIGDVASFDWWKWNLETAKTQRLRLHRVTRGEH